MIFLVNYCFNFSGLTNPFYTYHAKHIQATTKTNPVFVQLDYQDEQNNTFDINWKSLEKQLDEGLGLLIVCNPGNPSGKVYSKDELTKLAKLCSEKKCFLCKILLIRLYNKYDYD